MKPLHDDSGVSSSNLFQTPEFFMLLSIAPEILVVAFALLLGLTYSTNSLLLNLIERKKAAIRDSAADSVDAADLP